VFRTVSLLHESRCKLAELVPWTHRFAKQGRVRIFCNERTRSIPLDTKLMFWGVSDHFDTARKSMQNWPNWCHYRTSSLNKVASEFFATNASDPIHLTKNSCFGAFWTVLLLHESRCKTGRTGTIKHKFAKGSCFEIFRNERTWSTPLDPKLMFWSVSDRFVTARKSMQIGRTGAMNAQIR
jgi:hypothetical protein